MPAVLPARNFFSSYFSSGQSCFKAPSRLIQAVEVHELTVVGQVGSVKTDSGFAGAGHKDLKKIKNKKLTSRQNCKIVVVVFW